jgi:hypothetical protein
VVAAVVVMVVGIGIVTEGIIVNETDTVINEVEVATGQCEVIEVRFVVCACVCLSLLLLLSVLLYVMNMMTDICRLLMNREVKSISFSLI